MKRIIRHLMALALITFHLQAQSALTSALELARAKRYAEAKQELKRVDAPSDISQRIVFYRLKAAIEYGLGNLSMAADQMKLALALAPLSQELLMATAVAEAEASRLPAAIEHLKAMSQTAASQKLIGDFEERQNHYVEAISAYQTAANLDPGDEQLRIVLALELIQHHSFEPALSVTRKSLETFPSSAKLRVLAGVAEYGSDRSDLAVESLTQAVELDPDLDSARTYLQKIVFEGSGPVPARTINALCQKNRIACAAAKVRSISQAGGFDAVKAELAQLRAGSPDDALAHCELGRAYERMGRPQDARPEMERCAALDDSPRNHFQLGKLYFRLGETSLQKEEFRKFEAAKSRLSEEVERKRQAAAAFEFLTK